MATGGRGHPGDGPLSRKADLIRPGTPPGDVNRQTVRVSALGKLTRRYGDRPWFGRFARLLVPVDRLVGRLTRGRVVALGLIPSLIITTVGRRSGQPRSNPLL